MLVPDAHVTGHMYFTTAAAQFPPAFALAQVNPAYVPDSTSSRSTASPMGAHGGDGDKG